MRILLVEDEKRVARFIQKGLREEGYAVDVVMDGEAGWAAFESGDHDLVVLDRMLPRLDGVELLRRMRAARARVPVLMLTARATIQDKVEGLSAGADDYLTKPFAFDELVARVRALLRRVSTEPGAPLRCADLEVDPVARRVTRAGRRIDLTPGEYRLLEFLLRNQGRVASRTRILAHVWQDHADRGTNVVSVYVNYVRAKIDKGFAVPLLHSVRGVGYVLAERRPETSA